MTPPSLSLSLFLSHFKLIESQQRLHFQVVLRGGVYNKRTNALGVPGLQGMGAQVLLVDNASNTYRLALDDGHIVNLR